MPMLPPSLRTKVWRTKVCRTKVQMPAAPTGSAQPSPQNPGAYALPVAKAPARGRYFPSSLLVK